MKLITKFATLCLLLGGLSTSPGIFAAELLNSNIPDLNESAQAQPKSSSSIAAAALKKDAVCTKCHDESEIKPVLEIYQTKHGVKGDPRTPGCQSCHGASDAHVKNACLHFYGPQELPMFYLPPKCCCANLQVNWNSKSERHHCLLWNCFAKVLMHWDGS